jgi:hypothetical protein
MTIRHGWRPRRRMTCKLIPHLPLQDVYQVHQAVDVAELDEARPQRVVEQRGQGLEEGAQRLAGGGAGDAFGGGVCLVCLARALDACAEGQRGSVFALTGVRVMK